MKKSTILFVALMLFFTVSASAQLKVSSNGNVSAGTSSTSASKLSVNSSGNALYSAYINGNCKVDSGFVNGNVYSPLYNGNDTQSLTWAINQLLDFNVYGYGIPLGPAFQNITPVAYNHFAIDYHDLATDFPNFIKTDENNNYVVNYAELVPLLVYSIQQMAALIQYLHPLAGVNQLLSDETIQEESQEEQQPQERPMMAAERFADAALYQNAPNPFTAQTEIRFRLPDNARDAYIYIFDMTGKTLKQLPVNSSMQSVTIQGYELSSGMYLYSLVIGGQEIETRRMILSK